jgi:ABC-type antimicrobial peptide transport system permease subunit
MGEQNFRRLFPDQSGYGVVLIDVGAADAAALQRQLSTELDDYAVTVDTTADRLAMYDQVANTYLKTFQTLGSLGLLLGTIGLAVVLLRGLVERKAELAMLAAIGFRRIDRLRLVLVENAYLLLIGLAIGVICAGVSILPVVISTGRQIQLSDLAITLAAVLGTGLLALVLAVWLGGRHITPADLRAE